MPKKHWHLLIFFLHLLSLNFIFSWLMEMLVDSFLSYFGYELDFKTFFFGVPKSCGTHLKWVAGQDFFVQFWIMSFQQYFSHIFFFFSSFVGQVVALTSSELLGKIFSPSFVGQVVAPTSNELLAKIFFTSFVGHVEALTSSELLAKIFLFSFESCPFNNISVIRIF